MNSSFDNNGHPVNTRRLFAHISRKQLKFDLKKEKGKQRPLKIKINGSGKEARIEIIVRDYIRFPDGTRIMADMLTRTVLNREKIDIWHTAHRQYPSGIVMPVS